MFGPRDLPVGVTEAYWIQFFLLPMLPWRLWGFCLLQFALLLAIYVAPIWPMQGNDFVRNAAVPSVVWLIYAIQLIAFELRLSFAPWIGRSKTEVSDAPSEVFNHFALAVSIAIAVHTWALSIFLFRLGMPKDAPFDPLWYLLVNAILVAGLFLSLTLFARSTSSELSRFCNSIPKRAALSLLPVLSLPFVYLLLSAWGPFVHMAGLKFLCFSLLVWTIAHFQGRKHGLAGIGRTVFIAGLVGAAFGVVTVIW